MTAQTRPLGTKAGRFLIVGLINTVIDMAVFAVLLGLGLRPLVANVLSWAVAVTFSYIVNSRWSFERDETLSTVQSVLRFISLGALISLGVSSGVIAAFAGWIGLWPAKILGVALAAVLNFFAARWSIEDKIG